MDKVSLLILAGGLGSRYQGQKQIDAVSDEKETLMEFALYDAIKAGIRKFVFIINNQFSEKYKEHLKTVLSNRDCTIHFVEQTKDKFIPEEFLPKLSDRVKPLGTAHAVYCANKLVNEAFITINADDFYGFQSFKTAFDIIHGKEISEEKFGMIVFKLKNTLSENGSVSRGICEIKKGQLRHVEEFVKISKLHNEISGLNEKDKRENLDPDALVSMNFWILHPSFFKMAENGLNHFLSSHKDLSKVEFYLPTVIDKALKEKKVKVKIWSTSEKWFGLTYPRDKQVVIDEISRRKKKELYPENLWK